MTDPGPVPLPTYPELPVIDGRLVLDDLDAWHLEVTRRTDEIDAALVAAVDAGDDRAAATAALGEFLNRSHHDRQWAAGYIGGRCVAVVRMSVVVAKPAPHGFLEGWAAGLRAGADRLEAMGRSTDAAFRRDLAELVTSGAVTP